MEVPDLYVIWSIGKAGWVSKAANYTSQLDEAKQFSGKAAIDQCVRHSNNKAMDWMPVRLGELQLVRALLK